MFKPIGFVKSDVTEKVDSGWGAVVSQIVVDEDLKDGLKGLDGFSHLKIIYHLNEAGFVKERDLVRRPKNREDLPLVGIFAQRSKDRPNGIGISSVKLISVDDNVVTVQGFDAINNTPVFDIKPYYSRYDLKPDATTPEWVDVIMQDYF